MRLHMPDTPYSEPSRLASWQI